MDIEDGAGLWYANAILRSLASLNFFSYAILRKSEWEAVLSSRGLAESEGGGPGFEADEQDRSKKLGPDARLGEVRSRYGLDKAGTMLVVALRYAPDAEAEDAASRSAKGLAPLPLAAPETKPAKVARFARANWYRETISRLDICARVVAEEAKRGGRPFSPPKLWHRFSNSMLPEKALAEAAGLGSIGRNGLLIARGSNHEASDTKWSSAVVLGLMLLPFDIPASCLPERNPSYPALSNCLSCERCVDACPGGALRAALVPVFDRPSCIQHYASIPGRLPRRIASAWKDQLYGCDICLEACPYFRPDPDARTGFGRIGGEFDPSAIAAMEDEALRAVFKGSALGQRWISPRALKRNAEMVASSGDRAGDFN